MLATLFIIKFCQNFVTENNNYCRLVFCLKSYIIGSKGRFNWKVKGFKYSGDPITGHQMSDLAYSEFTCALPLIFGY